MKNHSKLYNDTVDLNSKTYPDHMSELKGLAAGSEVPFDYMMLQNMGDEISTYLGFSPRTTTVKTCSDIIINEPWTMAHNEDAGPSVQPLAFIVQAKLLWLENKTETASKFTAYTYPGFLSGMAWGFNPNIVLTCDALFPKKVVLPGLVRYFVNRDMLGSTSTGDALRRLNPAGGIALGFSTNFGGLAKDHQPAKLFNVEVAQNNLNILEVTANNYTEHFNMYLRMDVDQYTDESSVQRLARAKQLGAPTTEQDCLTILGDTANSQYPIFRDGKAPDNAATVATASFNLVNKTVSVYQGNPKSTDPVMTFVLDF